MECSQVYVLFTTNDWDIQTKTSFDNQFLGFVGSRGRNFSCA